MYYPVFARLPCSNPAKSGKNSHLVNKPAAMMIWKGEGLSFLEMWAPQDKF